MFASFEVADASHALNIVFSCFFLDKILEKLSSSPENSMEVDSAEQAVGEEPGTLVKNCKFNMKLQMANSAWKQVLSH